MVDEIKDDEIRALTEIDDPVIKDIVDVMDPKFAKNLTLTKSEVALVKKHVDNMLCGEYFTVPAICGGKQHCLFSKECPLAEIKKMPVGRKCPFEVMSMRIWKDQYITALNADWNDRVERGMVMELVECDIMQGRANQVIARDGLFIEDVVAVNESTGLPITQTKRHVAYDVKDLYYKRKDKILKTMLATRESKEKANSASKDPAKFISDMINKYRNTIEVKKVVEDANVSENSSIDTKTDKDTTVF